MKLSSLVVLFSVLAGLGAGFSDPSRKPLGRTDQSAAKGKYSNEHRFVFYAILVGLYEDGVPAEAIDLIVPDPNLMADPKNPDQTNFVESCPLCAPAFDAFRIYKLRPVFYGQKESEFSTFGFGISDEFMKGLHGSPIVRRDTIRRMIESYITRRLETIKLDPEELTDIKLRLRDMKKDGHAALAKLKRGEHGEAFTEIYAGWNYCPNCAGVAPDPKDAEALK